MTQSLADPGYGDPLAPIGTEGWAKRWRLEFQTIVKDLPSAPAQNRRFFEIGATHRAWTLVTDAHGKPFADFDAFCACAQPWGLGMDPAKFRAYLEAEIGKREADLATVSPDGRAGNGAHAASQERNDKGRFGTAPNSSGDRTNSDDVQTARKPKHDKTAKDRAIAERAPAVVQELFTAKLLTQEDAARMAPAKPTPEKAKAIEEACEELKALDRDKPPRDVRKEAGAIVRTCLGIREKTIVEQMQRLWDKASDEERKAFLVKIDHN